MSTAPRPGAWQTHRADRDDVPWQDERSLLRTSVTIPDPEDACRAQTSSRTSPGPLRPCVVAESLLAFALVAALVTVTPGPDTVLVLSSAVRGGAARGLATTAGTTTGLYCWGVAAATGLSAVLTASQTAYTALRIAGALYLFWLGVKAVRSLLRPPATEQAPEAPAGPVPPLRRAYARGLLTNLLNPKIGVFYLSLLPPFIPDGAPALSSGPLLASVHAAEGLLFLGLVSLLAHRASSWLRRPSVNRGLDAVCAAVFIGFGARLALAR